MVEPIDPPLQFTDDNGDKRRTIADALDVLHGRPGFSEQTRTVLRTMPHPLPGGGTTWSALLICTELGCAVPLPTSIRSCDAIRDGKSVREEIALSEMDEAVVYADGKVKSPDGTIVRGLKFHPVHLLMSLTPQQTLIIRAAIRSMRAEKDCYRDHYSEIFGRGYIVFHECIDFRALLGRHLFGLKQFMRDLRSQGIITDASRQTVSNLLRDCGIVVRRRPKSTSH